MKQMKEVVAVLLNIRSVPNVGSIFRTADGAGILKLYLCGITPTPLDRFGKYRKDFQNVALGAEKTVFWERGMSAIHVIKKLKKEGYVIIPVEQAKNSVLYHTYRPRSGKIALVVGNELQGIPKSVLNLGDVILEIPMRGGKESLNVSVAFGIIVYYLLPQDKPSSPWLL